MFIFRIIAIVLWSGAALAGPYDGVYRPDADWANGWDCKTVGIDGGAFEFRDDRFLGIETACDLKKAVGVRDMQATLYNADCASEGENHSYRLLVMATTVGVAVITDGASVLYLRRCN